MQIEFKWKWGSHTVEEMDDYCSLVAKDRSCDMLVDSVRCSFPELWMSWSEHGRVQPTRTHVGLLPVALFLCSLLVYEAVIRHGTNIQPAWSDHRWTDLVALTRVSMQTVLVFLHEERNIFIVEHLPNLQEASSGLECVIHSNTQSL